MSPKAVLLLVAWGVPASLLVSLFADPPAAHPAPAVDAPALVTAALEGAWTALWWAIEHPRPAAILLGVMLLPLVAGAIVRALPRAVQKDDQRMFTAEQRREGFARAGGRCEAESLLLLRCRADASHGDHWFPWSLGGATSMENFVGMCPRHNTSKGAKVPSFWQTWRLSLRRRRYFPAHLDVRAGHRTPTLRR